HTQRPARAVTTGCAERTHVNAVRTAVDCVRSSIAGALSQHLRLDYLHDSRVLRIGLGVENVYPGTGDARNNQVPALHMWVGRIRTQAGTTRVPAEVVQFVSRRGHVHVPYELAVAVGIGIQIDNADGIRPPVLCR